MGGQDRWGGEGNVVAPIVRYPHDKGSESSCPSSGDPIFEPLLRRKPPNHQGLLADRDVVDREDRHAIAQGLDLTSPRRRPCTPARLGYRGKSCSTLQNLGENPIRDRWQVEGMQDWQGRCPPGCVCIKRLPLHNRRTPP